MVQFCTRLYLYCLYGDIVLRCHRAERDWEKRLCRFHWKSADLPQLISYHRRTMSGKNTWRAVWNKARVICPVLSHRINPLYRREWSVIDADSLWLSSKAEFYTNFITRRFTARFIITRVDTPVYDKRIIVRTLNNHLEGIRRERPFLVGLIRVRNYFSMEGHTLFRE